MVPDNQTRDIALKAPKARMGVRQFRPGSFAQLTRDKILEGARWALSGASARAVGEDK